VWQYWPETEEITLTEYRLSLVNYNKTDQLISRDIQLENIKTRHRHIVTQLQYIAWPDHGLPEHTDGFSKILDLVDAKNIRNGPIVVHCRYPDTIFISNELIYCKVLE
jgi:protein tyrosine phosphatase